jgi:phosphohistidine phosphatase
MSPYYHCLIENTERTTELSIMKLYLLRHGIAVDRIGGAISSDWQRPLTKEGETQTSQVAVALAKIGVKANLIITSPLVRARQTAEIVLATLAKGTELQIADVLSPGGTASDLYKVLTPFSQLEEIFLVGHEPDMSRLAGTLLWAGPELNIPFKKAGVCRIDISDIPPSSPGILKWFLTPKILCSIAEN